jgi:RNA polymerase sigma-70 factor (ECF subfamily)
VLDIVPGGAFVSAPLAQLYRRHWTELCAYARRTFGPGPPDPEDIVQAAFVRFAALPASSQIANPRAFLFRTAHNLAIDAHRRQARVGAAAAAELQLAPDESRDFSPEDVLVSREDLARLEAALATLKPRQRTALLMHRLDGASFAEIGRQLGMSPSGARKLVEQAFAAAMTAMKRRRR